MKMYNEKLFNLQKEFEERFNVKPNHWYILRPKDGVIRMANDYIMEFDNTEYGLLVEYTGYDLLNNGAEFIKVSYNDNGYFCSYNRFYLNSKTECIIEEYTDELPRNVHKDIKTIYADMRDYKSKHLTRYYIITTILLILSLGLFTTAILCLGNVISIMSNISATVLLVVSIVLLITSVFTYGYSDEMVNKYVFSTSEYKQKEQRLLACKERIKEENTSKLVERHIVFGKDG